MALIFFQNIDGGTFEGGGECGCKSRITEDIKVIEEGVDGFNG
jgi:hypothetical protein